MAETDRAREGGTTPLSTVGRAFLWANFAVVVIAGVSLYALAERADTDFAWSIKAPITASFLGAGYWGSMLSIGLAATRRDWQDVRIFFVTGFFLIGLMAVPTLIYVEEFHLDEGSATAKAVAWVWFVLYVGEAWVFLAFFLLHERAGGSREYAVTEPLFGWFRLIVAAHAILLTVGAIALWPLRADGFWPWTLPDSPRRRSRYGSPRSQRASGGPCEIATGNACESHFRHISGSWCSWAQVWFVSATLWTAGIGARGHSVQRS